MTRLLLVLAIFDDPAPILSPYGHECVDRPNLPCPACEWAQEHRMRSENKEKTPVTFQPKAGGQ